MSPNYQCMLAYIFQSTIKEGKAKARTNERMNTPRKHLHVFCHQESVVRLTGGDEKQFWRQPHHKTMVSESMAGADGTAKMCRYLRGGGSVRHKGRVGKGKGRELPPLDNENKQENTKGGKIGAPVLQSALRLDERRCGDNTTRRQRETKHARQREREREKAKKEEVDEKKRQKPGQAKRGSPVRSERGKAGCELRSQHDSYDRADGPRTLPHWNQVTQLNWLFLKLAVVRFLCLQTE